MSTFAEYLKTLMDEKELGVNELSDLSGVSGAHISRIINGKRSVPGPKTIKKLSLALNANYAEMMKIAGHIDDNNPSLALNTEKKPKDLQKILAEHELLFSGTPLDEEDKEEIYNLIQYRLYKRAKELNKRKPAPKGE